MQKEILLQYTQQQKQPVKLLAYKDLEERKKQDE